MGGGVVGEETCEVIRLEGFPRATQGVEDGGGRLRGTSGGPPHGLGE